MSQWHRVDAVEIWHFYAGAAARRSRCRRTARRRGEHRLGHRSRGRRAAAGRGAGGLVAERRSLGAWTLVGCTVAPGFDVRRLRDGAARLAAGEKPRVTWADDRSQPRARSRRRLINAWPSFDYQAYEGWILRLAKGYSKRANCGLAARSRSAPRRAPRRLHGGARSRRSERPPDLPADLARGDGRRRTLLARPRLRGDRADARLLADAISDDCHGRSRRSSCEAKVTPRWVRETAHAPMAATSRTMRSSIEIVSRIRQTRRLRDARSRRPPRRLGARRRRARLCRTLRHRRRARAARHRPWAARRHEPDGLGRAGGRALGLSPGRRGQRGRARALRDRSASSRSLPLHLTGSCAGRRLGVRAATSAPATMSAQASASVRRRLGIAGRDEDQRRQHRGRIGGDAEQADVAALHADVPDVEGRPDRPEAERERPRAIRRGLPARASSRRRGGRARLSAAVARQKPATASVGTSPKRARQDRIAGPDEGAGEGAGIARAMLGPRVERPRAPR